MKRLLLIGFVLISMFTSAYSLTLNDITISSTDNTSVVIFNQELEVENITIGTDYIYLENYNLLECTEIKSLNVTNQIFYTSSLTCPTELTTQSVETNRGLTGIIFLCFVLLFLGIFTSSHIDREYQKTVSILIIAAIILLAVTILFL